MELRQLRYLAAVVEEANFTRAADKVFVSQSALSQQIQSLEQEVGTVLLDRSRRGVTLTAAGEILYRHAQRVFLELEQAEIAMHELDGLLRGDLRVGVVQTVNDYLMPALVAAFAAQYPDIRLYVDELPSDEVEARLENGRLQVGLSFLPATQGGIEASPLLEERLVLIARDDHILAAESDVAVESLDGMPLVMLANTFCTRRLWEENARLAGAQPQVVMEMNTVSSILAVVEKTGLATVLPALTLADERLSHLRRIPLSKPTPMRTVGIMWPKERYMCSASRTFIDTAKKVVEGLGE